MTNIMNTHTCSVCRMDLLVAMVGLPGGEPLQVVGDVMSSTRVRIPRRVYGCHLSSISSMRDSVRRHGDLLLCVAPVVANAKKRMVKPFVEL